MYSIASEPDRLQAGKHQNLVLSSVGKETTQSGKVTLLFKFKAKNGDYLDKMVFEPTIRSTESVGQALEFKKWYDRELKDLLKCFLSSNDTTIESTSWEGFVDSVITKLTGKTEGILLNAIIEYNDKNYPQLAKWRGIEVTPADGSFNLQVRTGPGGHKMVRTEATPVGDGTGLETPKSEEIPF